MKIAIIGGHPTPAFAVIEQMPQDAEVVFIGRKYMMEGDLTPSFEYSVIKEKRIPFVPLNTGRIQRTLTSKTIPSMLKVPAGFVQAVNILREQKPDVVLGFGGYVSVPVCMAAQLLRIPFIIHEQTLEAGLANKLLAKFATKICISWQQSAEFFPQRKTVLTGNPVREFKKTQLRSHITGEELPLIYITGGSTGSHAVNALVEGCLEELLKQYRVVHQTGDAQEFQDFKRLSELKASLPQKLQKRYDHIKFIAPDMVGAYMQKADLVIARSGMNTVTELLHFGKPCFLIPLPHGQRNEQLKNALFVKKVGIGEFALQDELTSEKLFNQIESMLEHIMKYKIYSNHAQQLVRSDAASEIIRVVYEVVKKKT